MNSAGMVLDLGSDFLLRRATEADHPALRMVCLRTGDAGKDATAREDDPDLIGEIYAVPYQVFEPDFAFVVEGQEGVAGYLFGAPNTAAFYACLTESWYPALQQRVTDPGPDASRWQGSDWARRRIHHPDLEIPLALTAFPSHGHIDLLPQARGKDIGRRCITFLEGRFAEAGSTGLWLEVHPRNHKALRFYASLGYRPSPAQEPSENAIYVVKRFAEAG